MACARRWSGVRLGAGLVALVATAPLPASAAEAPKPALAWQGTCPVAAPAGTRCGTLLVPERRDGAPTRMISVPVAVIPAPDQAKKAKDPFLFLMGGTGAGFSVLGGLGALPQVLNRDVIVVEQRGNPLASPFFGCDSVPSYTDRPHHLVWVSVPEYTGPKSVETCKAEIRRRGADLDAYMTPSAADDLIDLRHLLGVASWNVYGVSYGGRVATTLLRKDPAAVRAMILDSAQITGAHFSGWDRLRAVGNFFERCRTAERCGKQFPDLRATFEATVARLAAKPAALTVAGKPDTLNAREFIGLVAWSLYHPGIDVFSRVPAAIMDAGRGNYGPLLATRGIFAKTPPPADELDPRYPANSGHIAQQVGMMCAEEVATHPGDAAMNASLREGWSKATIGVVRGEELLERKVCREWGFAAVDPAQGQPPRGDAPTLLLYGEHDSVAPPFHGRIAAASLSHARMIVFPWTEHAISLDQTNCFAYLLAQFVTAPGAQLDERCAAAVPEPIWLPDMHGAVPGLELVQASAANAVNKFGLPARAAYVMAPKIGVEGVVAAGLRKPGSPQPLDGHETFRIASQTKTFTAVAILRLVEDGKVQLDQPIKGLIAPELEAALAGGGYPVDRITLRHLLNHTSGMPDYAMDPAYQAAVTAQPARRWTRLEQVQWAMKMKPSGAPGGQFVYSDTGYVLLGDVIERATGKPQAAAYRSLIDYDRIGLHNTWFETLEPALAGAPPRAGQSIGGEDTTGVDPSFDLYGGGGLVSTLEDQAHFIAALFTGKVFHQAGTLDLMQAIPSVSAVDGTPTTYALGIHKNRFDGIECWGHSGFWGSSMYYCPAALLTIALNRYTADEPTGYDGAGALKAAILMQRLRLEPAQRPAAR